MSNNVTRT